MQKKVPSRSYHQEHGAEIIYLEDDDVGKEEEDPDYFRIKLAYNGVHHYIPIVPSYVVSYLEACGHVRYYTKGARDALKLLMSHLPKNSNYYKLVSCAYDASVCTTTVLSGCNNLTGTTGTAGATSAAEAFSFPKVQPSSSGAKRKRTAPPSTAPEQAVSQEATDTATQEEQGEEEETPLTFQLGEKDDSPEITIKRHEELKHGPEQCFCGKADLKTQDDMDKHFKKAHFQKGRGINPKTAKKKDLWACHSCNKVCKDNRTVWKHFRTQHLNWYIHYCPIDGCGVGND